jgi:RNA polymerase sigma factor (sigma-70 family)
MRSDAELLTAWSAGDRAAGHDFYQRYADRVTRFFARKTDDELPDLVQRTFLKTLETARRGVEIGNPAALLFAIARNELYDQFGRRATDRDRFSPEHTSLADLRTGISTRLARHEQERLLLDALSRLPLDAQLALELYYWEELAMDDVARVLGITTSAALNRIHRARKLLRQRLAELEASPEAVDQVTQALETRPLEPAGE